MDSSSNISPGTIGAKIKRIRELRGLSKKELGLACGFSDQTAAVRIHQYENNEKTPKSRMISIIAKALRIDATALFDADLTNEYRTCHALFDLESFHGASPVEINGNYYLRFNQITLFEEDETGTQIWSRDYPSFDFNGFLKKWLEAKNKYVNPEDKSKIDYASYDLWKYEFPKSEIEFELNNTKKELIQKKEDLELRLKELDEEIKKYQ